MHAFTLPSPSSLEQEEIEALTLQLMKTKQLLMEQRCLLTAREQAAAEVDSQLAQERGLRQSLEQQLQQLQTEFQAAQEWRAHQEQLMHNVEEQQLQKNEKIALQTTQVVALENETARLQEALQKARKAQETRDEDVKTAQQHMAKKVRETARLQEQLETLTTQMQGLQDEARQKRLQAESLKNELSRWQRREVQLQEQLREHAVTAELKVNQLEANYADIMERWKLAEMQLQKLRYLEGQQQQMRAILVDLDPKQPLTQALPEQNSDHNDPATQEPLILPPTELHIDPPVRMRQNFFDQ